MSGKTIKEFGKITKYRVHDMLLESYIKPEIKKTTPSAITALKEIAFHHQLVSLSANQIGLEERLFVALKNEYMKPGQWTDYKLDHPSQYEAIVNIEGVDASDH